MAERKKKKVEVVYNVVACIGPNGQGCGVLRVANKQCRCPGDYRMPLDLSATVIQEEEYIEEDTIPDPRDTPGYEGR